jgi:non-heme chloroperoxidase
LISSITPYLLKTDDNPDGVPQDVFDDMAMKMQDDRIGFLDDFGKTFFGVSMFSKPVSEPLLDYYRTLGSVASPRATLLCAKAFSSTDFRTEMKTINVPTLIIHGDEDETVPIDPTGKEAAKAIPNSELIVYPGAAHGLFYTEKARLNADLIEFLNS